MQEKKTQMRCWSAIMLDMHAAQVTLLIRYVINECEKANGPWVTENRSEREARRTTGPNTGSK
jgi:hypothetical protein